MNITEYLTSSSIAFCSYTENLFLPMGKVRITIKFNGRSIYEDFHDELERYDKF